MKLFSRKAGPAAAEIDPAYGDEQAHRLRAELSRGKWNEAQAALDATKGNWNDGSS